MMNRRRFLSLLGVAPPVAVGAVATLMVAPAGNIYADISRNLSAQPFEKMLDQWRYIHPSPEARAVIVRILDERAMTATTTRDGKGKLRVDIAIGNPQSPK